ncbi:MAG TPA: hypothetical protein PK698_06570 [Bacilli bacterium]|jgi:hypothetical protein|nr:hypothetical protein [Bacilli bacterium]
MRILISEQQLKYLAIQEAELSGMNRDDLGLSVGNEYDRRIYDLTVNYINNKNENLKVF